MAHIPDGVLSFPVLAGGGALAVAGLAVALRRLREEDIPKVALLSAAFFCVSLVAVPVGPSSVHLLLSGLMGLMIGWATLPAVVAGLALQAVLFGFGGLTTLGVNTVNIAGPGLLLGLLLRPAVCRARPGLAGVIGGACAAGAVAGTAGLVALSLVLSGSEFVPSARIILLTYVPLMLGEGAVTGFAVAFLKTVKPEVFAAIRQEDAAEATEAAVGGILAPGGDVK